MWLFSAGAADDTNEVALHLAARQTDVPPGELLVLSLLASIGVPAALSRVDDFVAKVFVVDIAARDDDGLGAILPSADAALEWSVHTRRSQGAAIGEGGSVREANELPIGPFSHAEIKTGRNLDGCLARARQHCRRLAGVYTEPSRSHSPTADKDGARFDRLPYQRRHGATAGQRRFASNWATSTPIATWSSLGTDSSARNRRFVQPAESSSATPKGLSTELSGAASVR